VEKYCICTIPNIVEMSSVSRYLIIKLRLWSSDDHRERNHRNRLNYLTVDLIGTFRVSTDSHGIVIYILRL